jgi:hypothetical protein
MKSSNYEVLQNRTSNKIAAIIVAITFMVFSSFILEACNLHLHPSSSFLEQ